MNGMKTSIVLYILGVIFIFSIVFLNDIYIGILFLIIGFILILISSLILPILSKKNLPTETDISEENNIKKELPTERDINEEKFIKKIAMNLDLNEDKIKKITSPISNYCLTKNRIELSKKTGITQESLSSYFDVLKNDTNLYKKVGERHHDIIMLRMNDVGLVGDIYLKLEKCIKELELIDLRREISDLIENYSERYSLSNFIECETNHSVLHKNLSKLIDDRNPLKFVEFLIRNRVGIPHYESNIFAFHMALYLLNQEKIIPKANDANNILSESLELLINETILRDIILENIKTIADSYMHNEISRKDASNYIIRRLEIYLNTLNITRKHHLK